MAVVNNRFHCTRDSVKIIHVSNPADFVMWDFEKPSDRSRASVTTYRNMSQLLTDASFQNFKSNVWFF